MTIGLIILGIASIFVFFGIAEKSLKSIGVAPWLVFIFIMALVIGAVVPTITIARFSFNIGGFIVPLAILALIVVVIGLSSDILRFLISAIVVASAIVIVRMLMPPNTMALTISSSLVGGFVGGAIAALIGKNRLPALGSSIAGVLLADVAVSLINMYYYKTGVFTLGLYGIFDSIVIAAIFSLLIIEAINGIRSARSSINTRQTALNTEAARDNTFDKTKKY